VYCTTEPYEHTPSPSGDFRSHVIKHRIWEGREVLRVHFSASTLLGDLALTEADIMAWAAVWEDCDNEIVPTFEKAVLRERADIRVKFSDSLDCSWSMVGVEAERIIDVKKPTMILNLKGLTRPLQKSIVIHEFGHALGLEHEHHHSDFWATVKKFIDLTKIPEDERIRLIRHTDNPDCHYDVDSIMHYW